MGEIEQNTERQTRENVTYKRRDKNTDELLQRCNAALRRRLHQCVLALQTLLIQCCCQQASPPTLLTLQQQLQAALLGPLADQTLPISTPPPAEAAATYQF